MSKIQKTVYRYSSCFKEKVIQEVSSGSSISEVCRRYDIKGGSTVQYWIKKFGRSELLNTVIRVKMRSEEDKIKQLEAENQRLKIALADAVLVRDVLETLIEVADEHYQTDLKKLRTEVISRCHMSKKQKVVSMCSYFQYQEIADCFPRQRGNVSMDNLSILNAFLYVAENGCKWRRLPSNYGNWHTVYTRINRWAKA